MAKTKDRPKKEKKKPKKAKGNLMVTEISNPLLYSHDEVSLVMALAAEAAREEILLYAETRYRSPNSRRPLHALGDQVEVTIKNSVANSLSVANPTQGGAQR
jgi:hypothetical protein